MPSHEELKQLGASTLRGLLHRFDEQRRKYLVLAGNGDASAASTAEWYARAKVLTEHCIASVRQSEKAANIERSRIGTMRDNDAFVVCAKLALPRSVYLSIWEEVERERKKSQ